MKKLLVLVLAVALLLSSFSMTTALGEEKPTLRFLGFNAAIDVNEDVNAKEIEDATGYHVEYYMLPAENADEKLNLELASGSSYDIVKMTPTQYYQLVGRGALQPLDDLLQEYGKNILSTVKDSTWKGCEYNGHIYGVPMRKEYTKDVSAFIIYRKDILNKLSLECPTTPEELYNVLSAVKAAYPDMIPLTGPQYVSGSGIDQWVTPETITSAFGVYNDWQDFDGKVIPLVKNPNMKAVLNYMNKLYSEGLLDADWAINTGTIIQEKFSSGKAFAATINWNTAMTLTPATLANIPEAEVEYMLPLKDENGNAGVRTTDSILYYSCIPVTSKNAIDAIKYMDSKVEWDNFLYLSLGTEGETFSKEENPNAESGYDWLPIMPKFAELRTNSYWYINSIDEYNYPDMWMARVRKSEAMWDAFSRVSRASVDAAKPDPIGYMPPLESVSKYNQAISQMATDYFLNVITGAESIETYDSFVSEWENAGGAEVEADINNWYTDFKAE